MLSSLYISQYVLIDHLQVDFSSGFSVISGETGAGKSILLGALSLVLGGRADTTDIAIGADKCVIEANFSTPPERTASLFDQFELDFDPEECILRREVSSKGKSRAFVNDTPVSLGTLKLIGESLVDIHSQHKNLLLGNPLFQLSAIDIVAETQDLLEEYQRVFGSYQEQKQLLEKLSADADKDAKEADFLRFQYQELDGAKLIEGEETALEEELKRLAHTLEISESLSTAIAVLSEDDYSTLSSLHTAIEATARATNYAPSLNPLLERLRTTRIELRDIEISLTNEAENLNTDPNRLSIVEERLDQINTLLHKHRLNNTTELIKFYNELKDRIDNIDTSDDRIAQLRLTTEQLLAEVNRLGDELSRQRKATATNFAKALEKELQSLGMSQVKFQIELSTTPPSSHGKDKAVFLFSANAQRSPEAVAEIASGGEISRLMLTLKAMLAKKKELPAIIFDEVDTGISGDVALRVAKLLQQMGHRMQVIAITHTPQIAAHGKSHYFVYKRIKDGIAETHLKKLNETERIAEIARMQSGTTLSAIGLAAATELLQSSLDSTTN
ncbi:MAG: DNA repair protein RecN [Porphyromonas sp.]|nr:DNA repair protein RecN [Porphyromonas sp.]